jgi:Abortive infection alpha
MSDDDLLSAAPGLVRIAAGAWLRTVAWTAETSLDAARSLLGDGRDPEPPAPAPSPPRPTEPRRPRTLRDRGAELLARSADVDYEQEAHPAYARILDELVPDEARVLRFLKLKGAQPAVDVRAGKVPLIASELVAPGLSMIGAGAGCRYVDRVPAYLNNLYRLGLIWFSREPLEDPLSYQVLEAQPDVLEAMRAAGRGARTVRRQILLTPFGEDFCRLCLP